MSGIIGVFSLEEFNAFESLYYGIYAIQHRGQGAVGIGTIDSAGEMELIHRPGLLSDSFGKNLIDSMKGNKGVGHVHYPFENCQSKPMPIEHQGALIAFDGKIQSENFDVYDLMERLGGDIEALEAYMTQLNGKFTMIYMNHERFIAYKHLDGIKPLAIGKKGEVMIAASETSGIEGLGGRIIRELQAGELFVHTRDKTFSYYFPEGVNETEYVDAFEFIYTARPDSVIDGISVYDARYRLGEALWYEDKLTDAIVVGAPDSGIIYSLGYANASGLLYQLGFVRNRYVGRTFIQSSQIERDQNIHIKLTPIKQNIMNRNIILIDDSIVRGSTITRTVKSLKDAGAKSVHVRIAAPPIVHSESVTVDIPDQSKLIAYNYTLPEMEAMIGCDSLRFLSLDGFHRAIGRNQMYEPYFAK